jgi:hypothetical protein
MQDEPTEHDYDDALTREVARILALDPTYRVIRVGPMTHLSVHPIDHGRMVELGIATATGGAGDWDNNVYLTPAEARELAQRLLGADRRLRILELGSMVAAKIQVILAGRVIELTIEIEGAVQTVWLEPPRAAELAGILRLSADDADHRSKIDR